MNRKKMLKFKKFNFHPVITFVLLTFFLIIFSGVLSLFNFSFPYTSVNENTLELKKNLVTVVNLFNYDGLKYIISNAARNFASFTPLSDLLIALIGLSVAQSTGLIDAFTKRVTLNINNKKITFIIILFATISSLINDIGYVVLIPLSALVFLANGRNAILGVITAFCGVAFGYGATIFVGSAEVALISSTTLSARIIDKTYHVQLSSNLIIMIITTILLSILGTFVIEKIIAPRIGKSKVLDEEGITKEINLEEIAESEQKKIELEYRERKGLKKAFFVGMIFVVCFIYMLIPSLPFSGLLLDMKEKTYLNQVFGDNSYFQDGFTYMVSLLFLITGIAYGLAAKTIKSSKDILNKATEYLKDIGILIIIIFFAAQFIAVFKKTNIGTCIVALTSEIISKLSFSGIPLIIIVMVLIAICNLFVTTASSKWIILAPVVVPLMMQSNISPQFAQFIMRASDSMTKGITPLLAHFVIYIGYLNIYNNNKETITIKKAVSYILPYCIIISLAWIAIILGWYLLGAPIGIGVNSTL